MAAENLNSILVSDIGNVHTRLMLLAVVEGQYRLVATARARTTVDPPLGSVSIGLDHAATDMSARIGRQLISDNPEHLFRMPERAGHGVDAFLATASAGRPLRALLVGLTPEISLASGRRVLAGTYVTITDMLCPDDVRDEQDRLNAVLTGKPDLVLIVGGTDEGAGEILLGQVKTVEQALSLLDRNERPAVLFSGNRALRIAIKDLLEPLTTVFFAKNVRPTLDDEQLFPAQIELALVYDDYRARSAGGFHEIVRQSQFGVVPTAQGYISAIRYLGDQGGRRRGPGPLCIDIGSATSLILATIDGQPYYSIRSDLGVGHNMVSALETITPNRLRRWLPRDLTDDALWDYAYNKELRPSTVPGNAEDLLIEQAFAREIIRELVAESHSGWGTDPGDGLPGFQPIIGAGAVLTGTQHPGISAMLLLDALQPSGIVELRLDPGNLISALGVIAYLQPLVTVQAFETGGLVNLGTAFCPVGSVRAGREAMKVHVRVPEGPAYNRTIRGGEMWLAPVLPGTPAQVTIRLARGLTIGGKRRIRRSVVSGSAGIIFDARGRPLVEPRARDQALRLAQWQTAMTGREPELARLSETFAEPTPMPSVDDLAPDDPAALPFGGEEDVDALFS